MSIERSMRQKGNESKWGKTWNRSGAVRVSKITWSVRGSPVYGAERIVSLAVSSQALYCSVA